MNREYPSQHHPCFFLVDSLNAIGVNTEFAKDERTLGCWGMVFPGYDNRVLVYLIDNRWPHEAAKEDPAAKELISRGAIVCHAQRRDMDRIGGYHLPLAASPGFRPMPIAKTADCAMVGYIRDEGRARLLSDIGAKFTLNLAQNVFGKQAVETYCSALCGVNIPTRYGDPHAYDVAMRPYEIAACGVPLVTNDLPELEELGFIDHETCITYGVNRSILEAIEIAIDNPHIGFNARQLISERHEYVHRAKQVQAWLSA